MRRAAASVTPPPRRGAEINVCTTQMTSPTISAPASHGSASTAGLSLAISHAPPRFDARFTINPSPAASRNREKTVATALQFGRFGRATSVKYEKTRNGNPHQLTINQHCFPKKSIERFCNKNGVVEVFLIRENKIVSLKPDHSIFCARRVWDQRAESLFMRGIENAYQNLVSELEIEDWSRPLSIEEHQIISDMYSLWHVRCCWKSKYLDDQELVGILPARPAYSQDDREALEKSNIATSIDRGTKAVLPGRHIAGILVQNDWGRVRSALGSYSWGIVESECGEFIVPDKNSVALCLPVTPAICFFAGQDVRRVVTQQQSRHMNAVLRSGSEQYYFGRSL